MNESNLIRALKQGANEVCDECDAARAVLGVMR